MAKSANRKNENGNGGNDTPAADNPPAQENVPAQDETSDSNNGRDILIKGTKVFLPNYYLAMVGQPLTAELAMSVFMHRSGQFRNNQSANADARADRYTAAKTDAEREANAPWSDKQYVELWEGTGPWANADGTPNPYTPKQLETTRTSAAEKLNNDAAEAAWAEMVMMHNTSIASMPNNSGPKLIARAPDGQLLSIAKKPVKGRGQSKEAHEAELSAFMKAQAEFNSLVLASKDATLAGLVQKHKDILEAKAGAKKAEVTTTVATTSMVL